MEVTINPTTELVDPRAGLPQAKQLTGRECNPTHQQIIVLKFYRVWPCPLEQELVFPTTSPSHQEALRAVRRSKKNHNPIARTKTILQKVYQNEKAESFVLVEGTS